MERATTNAVRRSGWNAALWVYVILFFVFLYGPLLTLIAFSFNDAEVVALPFRGFTLSFDEFIRTIFVLGSERTVPIQVWSLVIEQIAPFLPAVSVVIMVISVSASLIGLLIASRSDRVTASAKA